MPEIPVDTIFRAALVFLRVGGILFFLPIFGENPTPVRARILLAGALSLIFFNLVPVTLELKFTYDVIGVGWALFKELLIGFVIGYVAKLCFDGLLMAANLVGYQMGFGTADLFFMTDDLQINSFTALHRVIVMMLFLGMNLHYVFLQAIADSFVAIPVAGAAPHSSIGMLLIQLTAETFSVALQLASPILIALLFTMAALGLIARTVPQLNVFAMSFPASFFIGLLVYIASFPFFPEWMRNHFLDNQKNLEIALKGLTP